MHIFNHISRCVTREQAPHGSRLLWYVDHIAHLCLYSFIHLHMHIYSKMYFGALSIHFWEREKAAPGLRPILIHVFVIHTYSCIYSLEYLGALCESTHLAASKLYAFLHLSVYSYVLVYAFTHISRRVTREQAAHSVQLKHVIMFVYPQTHTCIHPFI